MTRAFAQCSFYRASAPGSDAPVRPRRGMLHTLGLLRAGIQGFFDGEASSRKLLSSTSISIPATCQVNAGSKVRRPLLPVIRLIPATDGRAKHRWDVHCSPSAAQKVRFARPIVACSGVMPVEGRESDRLSAERKVRMTQAQPHLCGAEGRAVS
jgi:hypothetical protein